MEPKSRWRLSVGEWVRRHPESSTSPLRSSGRRTVYLPPGPLLGRTTPPSCPFNGSPGLRIPSEETTDTGRSSTLSPHGTTGGPVWSPSYESPVRRYHFLSFGTISPSGHGRSLLPSRLYVPPQAPVLLPHSFYHDGIFRPLLVDRSSIVSGPQGRWK